MGQKIHPDEKRTHLQTNHKNHRHYRHYRHYTRALLACILLLAFALRMAYIQSRPMWYDEAIAVLHASLSPAELIYGTVTPVEGAGAANVHPLLYFFLLHGWIDLAGSSPLAVRFLSVVFGMLTVALLSCLVGRFFGRRTGLAVAILAAIHPFHVAYSQETRMYALLGLTMVVAAWGLLRALETGTGRRSWKWWSVYAMAAALTMYTHNLGAFPLLALNLLAVLRRRWWRSLPALIAANLAAVVLYSPWLVGVLPGQLGFVSRGYWVETPGVAELLRAILLPAFTFYEPLPLWLLGLELFVCLLLLVVLVIELGRARARASGFLLLAYLPVVGMFLISQWKPIYLERALLPSALFLLVAIGWLLSRRRLARPLRLGMMALLLAVMAGSLVVHYSYREFPRPPFPSAITYLWQNIEPADVIVHTNKLTYLPMHYYDPALPGDFLADPPGSPQDTFSLPTQESLGIYATSTITEAVGGAERVWLVYFSRELKEVERAGVEHPVLAWMEQHFEEEMRVAFADLEIVLYKLR